MGSGNVPNPNQLRLLMTVSEAYEIRHRGTVFMFKHFEYHNNLEDLEDLFDCVKDNHIDLKLALHFN